VRRPARRLHVVLVNDGSSDGTLAIIERWCQTRASWTFVSLGRSGGKGSALNAGIEASPGSELVVTCDADVELARDCLVELVRPFADRRVGAASALLWPANAEASTVARYCALEMWQHQLVTSAGKDRLGLNPPALGGLACYRRQALEAVGGFPADSLGEDVEVTNALTGAGWETRFVPTAKVASRIPERVGEYWHQHIRWSRGLFDALPHGAHQPTVPARRRVEAWLLATGYLDRIALGGAAFMAGMGLLPTGVPAGYLALTAVEAVIALGRAPHVTNRAKFIAAAAGMFPVDLAASLAGSVLQMSGRSRAWHGRSPAVRRGGPRDGS